MHQQQTSCASTFLSDCERIHREWHARAKALDSEGLLALYAADAVLESPLVTAILDGRASGILRGHDELRLFFAEGARRRPNELVRWYRTGTWLTDGSGYWYGNIHAQRPTATRSISLKCWISSTD